MIARRRPIRLSFTAARNQSGMSLLEIIIVIVLIGAVLTLVASRVLGGADRGKANIAKAQVQTMAGKIESFQMDTGRLPTSLEELVTQPSDVIDLLDADPSPGRAATQPEVGREFWHRRPSPGTQGRSL